MPPLAGAAATDGYDTPRAEARRLLRIGIQAWLDHFQDEDYDVLRWQARHRTYLHNVPAAPVLQIRDRRDGSEYSVQADHCVLALPLAPLRKVSQGLPAAVREDLGEVFGFPLLKCFLVTKKPWWRDDMPPHTGAAAIPTRELHFWTASEDGTRLGMAMLYTDHPAADFWKPLITTPLHEHAQLGPDGDSLKLALVRNVMILARRYAHRQLSELLLDEGANKTAVAAFHEQLGRALGDGSATVWRDRYEELIGQGPEVVTTEHVQRVLDVLRHPGHPSVADAARKIRQDCKTWLDELVASRLEPEELRPLEAEFPRLATEVVFPDPSDALRPMRTEDLAHTLAKEVVAWGIRDWSRPPVSAGCHAWKVGAKSWEVMARLEPVGRGRGSTNDG